MNITDKLKGFLYEEPFDGSKIESAPPRTAAPLMPRTIPVADGLMLDQGIARGLTWQPDVMHLPAFVETEREILARFREL